MTHPPSGEDRGVIQDKRSDAAMFRRGFFRGLALGLIPLFAILILSGGLIYGQSGGDALFIDPSGRVGIGTDKPETQLDVRGDAAVSGKIGVKGDATIGGKLGIGKTIPTAAFDVTGNAAVSGKVGIGMAPSGDFQLQIKEATSAPNNGLVIYNAEGTHTANMWVGKDAAILELVPGRVGIGMSPDVLQRANASLGVGGNTALVGKVWINTGSADSRNPEAALTVEGDALIKGRVTSLAHYQRDDEPETTYEIFSRYHLSLTAPKYGGRTKAIPHDTLVALCGDQDGCQVRLAMTRWTNDTQTESASRTFMFYYSGSDGHWRSGWQEGDISGVDGNGVTQHAYNIWNTCFFTDGTYSNYKDEGDKVKGMQLLVWNNQGQFNNRNRTCELTLMD